MAERLETMEKANDIQRRLPQAAACRLRSRDELAQQWLSGGAAGGFEAGGFGVSSPVVEYTREVQRQANEELILRPEGSVIVEMMGDYAIMREQALGCN